MNKSVTLHETADYCGYEFDYQADFTQFLEEARNNTSQGTQNTSHLRDSARKQLVWEKKNSKKSWKSSLLSWLRTADKKSKSTEPPMSGATVPKPRHGHFSGPVPGTVRGRIMTGSGPLTGLFGSRRVAEEYDEPEVPYMCLGQLDNQPQKLHSYGPVYLVT